MAQPFGVIHVLISCQSTEHGLPQHADKRVPSILPSARVGEHVASHRGETQRVVEFPISEQPGVRGYDRSAKLEHQAAVEIDTERPIVRFTRRVRHQVTLKS